MPTYLYHAFLASLQNNIFTIFIVVVLFLSQSFFEQQQHTFLISYSEAE